jgi:hypothetical protein
MPANVAKEGSSWERRITASGPLIPSSWELLLVDTMEVGPLRGSGYVGAEAGPATIPVAGRN